MTPHHIALVQDSFARVLPIQEAAARLFYGRLFEIAPDSRVLFRGDMRHQGAKLMAALDVVVRGLTDLAPLLPTIDALARRHADYGVVDRHYYAVGAALLWTLEQGLGSAFTPDVRAAWTEAYGLLSTRMIAAAHEAGAVASAA